MYTTVLIFYNNVQESDAQIGDLYERLNKRSDVLLKFHGEAARLPQLLEQLQHITDSLGNTHFCFMSGS